MKSIYLALALLMINGACAPGKKFNADTARLKPVPPVKYGTSDTIDGSTRNPSKTTSGEGGDGGGTGKTTDGETSQPPRNPSTTDTSIRVEPCNDVKQQILVLDFKSGWWGGDGGDFFETILGHISNSCATKPYIEYYHLTKAEENNSPNFDVSKFTQIWILSGSYMDEVDLTKNSKLLAHLIERVKASNANIFIGAGNGAIDHSNRFATALVGQAIFASGRQLEGDITEVNGTAKVVSRTLNSSLGNGLLVDVTAELPDATYGSSAKEVMYSDHIILSPESYQLHATCQMAKDSPTKGTLPCIASMTLDNRKFVIDSGLQRFYALYEKSEVGVLQYVTNITRSLSK